jgi:Tol biopolymer transport system component
VTTRRIVFLLSTVALLPACGTEDGTTTFTPVTVGAGVTDASAPGAISTLRVVAVGASSVTLEWEAPGDDGVVGTAVSYDLRYYTSSISDLSWDGASQASGEPAPSAAGTTQSLVVDGLPAGSILYFALRSLDDGPNLSALSNQVRARIDTVPGAVFMADKDVSQKVELYAADLDGTTVIKLSGAMPASADLFDFSVSPDRAWVAFRANAVAVNRLDLFIVPIRGGARVTSREADTGPGGAGDFLWSPSGSRLAYVQSSMASRSEVHTMRPDGTERFTVSGTQSGSQGVNISFGAPFAWSPDETRLAYTSDEQGGSAKRLFSVGPDGADRQEISGSLLGDVLVFKWAPNSTRVAYMAYAGGSVYELRSTLAASAAGDVVLTSSLVNNVLVNFEWAPDTSRIAFKTDVAGARNLFSCLPAGGGTAQVSGPRLSNGTLDTFAWAPDASRVAYLADQTTFQVFELFTSSPDGTGNVKVSGPMVSGGDVRAWAWAPDSSRIAYLANQTVSDADLYVSSPDTSAGNLRVSDRNSLSDDVLDFRWAPDSSRLAYRGKLNSIRHTELFTAVPTASGNTRVSGPLVDGGAILAYRWVGSTGLAYAASQEGAMRVDLFVSPATTSVGNIKISGPRVAAINTTLKMEP